MKIIVQKFGGTSVANNERRHLAANKVIDAIKKGFKPVVVVSAIGRKGDPYATDTLLSLLNSENIHIDTHETDLLMCCGEIISAVIMSKTFSELGFKSRVLTGGNAGIITDENYGNANIVNVNTDKIQRILEMGVIPIVTGFQGITKDGELTTIGRGGSDVTASVLGEALNASCIEIYTDVDGIMTADPRIVPEAKVINSISFNEIFEFADQGAKVIHPRAVEYAMNGNVPIVIKNTMSDAPGTKITISKSHSNKIVTGISHVANRTQIIINFNTSNHNINSDIFEILADNNITIELINIFPNQNIFTIDGKDEEKATEIITKLGLDFQIISNCSRIAVIGNRLRETPGIMAKILKSLSLSSIKVLQTADSQTTVWCLVSEIDTVNSINTLHSIFCI